MDDNADASDRDVGLNAALAELRTSALNAVNWYADNTEEIPRPLELIKETFSEFDLLSADLGERGFVVDSANKTISFNKDYLHGIITKTRSIFRTPEFDKDNVEIIVKKSIALYVFHESFHINQNFLDHKLASIIKSAFGSDELSKIDVYADVVSAHCEALVAMANQGKFSLPAYYALYASNIMLSYTILTNAFSRAGAHKKRRALGLMTSRILVEKLRNDAQDDDLAELSILPIYTGVSTKTGHIISLVCKDTAWEILFYVDAEKDDLQNLWKDVGQKPPEDVLALLISLCGDALPSR